MIEHSLDLMSTDDMQENRWNNQSTSIFEKAATKNYI